MSRRKSFGCLLILVLAAVLLALGWHEVRVRAEHRLRAELQKLEGRTAGRQRASFGRLELRPWQLGGSLHDLSFEMHAAEAEPLRLEADELRLDHLMPEMLGQASDLNASLVGLRSAALDRELARLPGLRPDLPKPCRLDVTLQMRYEPRDPRALTLKAHVRAPALGRAELRLITQGLDPRQLEAASKLLASWARSVADGTATDEHALDALAGAALIEAELVFDDDGLAAALLEREARRQGLTSEQARDKLRVDLWQRLESGPIAQAWSQEAGRAAESFVGEPRRLRVTLDPAEPVELASLPATARRGAQALAEELGFSAEANGPR